MLFNLSKVFVALAAVTAVVATPAKRQEGLATCDFVLKPAAALPADTNLVAEFNYVIGRSLAAAANGAVNGSGPGTIVVNADGTYSVEKALSAEGKTAAETAAILTGFAGTTLTGFTVDWLAVGQYSTHQRLDTDGGVPMASSTVAQSQAPLLGGHSTQSRQVPHTSQALPPHIPLFQPPPSSQMNSANQWHGPAPQLQIPGLVPYSSASSRFEEAGVFGVPMAQPSGSANRRSAKRMSKAPRNSTKASTDKGILKMNVMMVILPKDVDPLASLQDRHGLPMPDYLPLGEELAPILGYMEGKGLAKTVFLRCRHSSDNLLPDIVAHFEGMLAAGNFIYPDADIPEFELGENEPNRELRVMAFRLPFHLVSIGNWSRHARPKLSLDKVGSLYTAFTYKTLKNRFHRAIAKHPTEPENIHGLLFVCPKHGGQLTGPINESIDKMHYCWSDVILAHWRKDQYLNMLDLSAEMQLARWKEDWPHGCRTSCPQSAQDISAGSSNVRDVTALSDSDYKSDEANHASRSGPPRRSRQFGSPHIEAELGDTARPTNPSSSMLSPLVNLLDIVSGPPPLPTFMAA
ncbi:hypothetical protein B0H34DRAFT_801322 [Crassisporium funariophilum]|nr:hypothetical protein B0H34DRAFT_801322 [Crassisporium funariophilum]